MEKAPERPVIDEIIADLGVYQNPKILLDEYKEIIAVVKVNQDDLKKYSSLLFTVSRAWRKTLKYHHYFQEFYPPEDKVNKVEVLNHHIHAYLEDMTILKNKIEVLLGEMKNDIKKVAPDKKGVDAFFRAGVEKTGEVFAGITKHRNPHHHSGTQFYDGDLLKAENARTTREMLDNPMIDSMLNQEHKPELIAKTQKDEQESFDVAMKHWIDTAAKNDEQTSGYLNAVLEAVKGNLYLFLNIKPVKEIIETAKNH
ncbi:MAG TPA: hypothetical protein VJH55_03085 [Candidatus Paceibacterota bacterium]